MTRLARLLILVTLAIGGPVSVFAESTIEKALGGPAIICTGAVAWTEDGTEGAPRVEPLRLAVRDAEEAGAVALFLSDADFVAADVWACTGGLCTASSTLPTASTTNVMRLRRKSDLASGEVVYGMEAVFIIVAAGGEALQVDWATGRGAFTCEKALPTGVVQSGKR
jgi:hypothetical protein